MKNKQIDSLGSWMFEENRRQQRIKSLKQFITCTDHKPLLSRVKQDGEIKQKIPPLGCNAAKEPLEVEKSRPLTGECF